MRPPTIRDALSERTERLTERAGFERLAAIACATILATAVVAQTAETKLVRFDTDDGSRFLLAPDADGPSVPPLVHWAMLTPAGPRFDPPGFEGLSFAAARAALNGTIRHGSRAWDEERRSLAAVDQLEWQIAQLRFEDRPIPSELGDALLVARKDLRELSDPVAWQRALRSIPVVEIGVNETPEGSILELATTWSGLRRCAELLHELREDAQLRGIHAYFRQVREELRRRDEGLDATVRHELQGLAFDGLPSRRVGPRDPPLRRATALDVYAATHAPFRGFHVLTGRFEPVVVEKMLRDVFRESALASEIRPTAIVPPGSRRRESVIPGGRSEAVAIGYQLSDRMNPTTVAVLAEWLAGGSGSVLPSRLRAAGFGDITVDYQVPFPGNASPGLLMLELGRRSTPAEDEPSIPLLAETRKALAAAIETGPTPDELQSAIDRAAGRRARAATAAGDRAVHLAIECGLLGRRAEDVLGPTRRPDRAEIRALAESLLLHAGRTIVSIERTP